MAEPQHTGKAPRIEVCLVLPHQELYVSIAAHHRVKHLREAAAQAIGVRWGSFVLQHGAATLDHRLALADVGLLDGGSIKVTRIGATQRDAQAALLQPDRGIPRSDYTTACRTACSQGDYATLELLLAAGHDADTQCAFSALLGGHTRCFELILHTCPMPVSCTEDLVAAAAEADNLRALRAALRFDAESEQCGIPRAAYPLHRAIEGGSSLAVVRELLRAGASLDVACSRGVTPVHCALSQRRFDILSLCLEEGVLQPYHLTRRCCAVCPLQHAFAEDDVPCLQALRSLHATAWRAQRGSAAGEPEALRRALHLSAAGEPSGTPWEEGLAHDSIARAAARGATGTACLVQQWERQGYAPPAEGSRSAAEHATPLTGDDAVVPCREDLFAHYVGGSCGGGGGGGGRVCFDEDDVVLGLPQRARKLRVCHGPKRATRLGAERQSQLRSERRVLANRRKNRKYRSSVWRRR